MAEESALPPTPQLFVDAVLAYQKTAAIRAAVEIGLFAAIGPTGADAEAIAAQVGASTRGVRILCDYLTVLGFLEKSGTVWYQAPVTRTFIDPGSPTSMASIIRFLAGPELLRLFLEDPAGYIRRGGSEGLANTTPDDPIWVTFAESMTPFTIAAAKATAAHVAAWPAPPRLVLDVAAGGGMFGISVAQACAGASVVAVDWSDVVAVADRNADQAGVGERYRTLAGDAFSVNWGSGYDLVLLPNILHHFDHASCVAMLRRVRDSLAPGGRAAIIEFVPDSDRVAPPIPASFAFMMVATTQHGDAFTEVEYVAMAREAGLRAETAVSLAPSPERLIELYA
ncbi:methyltransferase domain-containing protein [Belnapia sp. T6]|uniref:Methyltransferase domain-containing protein n=1 Tax=Belnapia mucosa TaxID=2804532 RepID=A0ABS1VC60_9PROT|nr:methyltransferase [Belnapia mucosa]MBL6459266.1 methyltransferase domain-containing protein [Belnapia mucosa]